MLLIRRLPGIIYNHKYIFLLVVVAVGLLVTLLLSWGFICTNWEPWRHVNKLCSRYKLREVVGDLCDSLCARENINSLSCHAFHAGKETVFTAVLHDRRSIVVKSAQNTEPQDIFHWIDHSGEHYPTEQEFQKMIQHRVSARLNITISEDESKRLSTFVSGRKSAAGSNERHKEMKEIWRLLQDNEYLLSVVYVQKEIFPTVIGSCGQYFAVEYLQPALDGGMFRILRDVESVDEWTRRVHLSVMLLDLVDQIDSEDLLLCDVKPGHFGMSTASGKLKVLDLDVTLPKRIADSITADGRSCEIDSQCHLFDCKSSCDIRTHVCSSPVISSNLQVVCEKIFLGWSMSGSGRGVVVPGLLMTPHTSSGLASLLRQCVTLDHHADDPETLLHTKQRLANTLLELDNILASNSQPSLI